MRTNEEQIKLILGNRDALLFMQRKRREKIIKYGSVAAYFVIIISVVLFYPYLNKYTNSNDQDTFYGNSEDKDYDIGKNPESNGNSNTKNNNSSDSVNVNEGESTDNPNGEINSDISDSNTDGIDDEGDLENHWAKLIELYVIPESKQWEFSDNKFQLCLNWNKEEYDSSKGIGSPNSEFSFKIYYRPSEDTNGEYKVINCPCESCTESTDKNVIYRLQTYKGGWTEYDVGQEYEIVVEIYKNGKSVAFGLTYITFDQSDLLELEKYKSYITKH